MWRYFVYPGVLLFSALFTFLLCGRKFRRRPRARIVNPSGEVLSHYERYYFDEGKFEFAVKRGTKSTLLHFTNRAPGTVSGGKHPDEIMIWIPTESIKAVKDAL